MSNESKAGRIRSAPLMARAVEVLADDFHHAADLLDEALAVIRELEPVARGINGISATLRAKGNEVETLIKVLRDEAHGLPRKMLPPAPGVPLNAWPVEVEEDQLEGV